MTKLDGVPDADDAKPGMAYFAGTGPWGTTCGSCKHRTVTLGSCMMYRTLTGGRHPRLRVKRDWPSCKYYEPVR